MSKNVAEGAEKPFSSEDKISIIRGNIKAEYFWDMTASGSAAEKE